MLLVLAALAGAIAALPVTAAQPAPPPSGEDIVVQGTRVGKQEINDFIKAVTQAPYEGQLGRFDDPACPTAMGLPPAQNASIAERMRRVAAAAGARVAPARCKPNIFVIVAPDKAAAIEGLDKRYPAYFTDMSSRDVKRLAAGPAPAVAWQVSTMLSADGQPLARPVGTDYYRVQGTENPSRIRSPTKPTFVVSVVVIDVKAAAGLTVTELADYAAMRTLAATDPDRILKTGAPSILGVLAQPDDAVLPLSLTYWDLAFLKSLYSTDNAYFARYQRGDMGRVIEQELKRSRGAKRPPR